MPYNKRFKIKKSDGFDFTGVVFSSDNTIDCYKFLLTQDMGLNSFIVECTVDDIEVSDTDFIKAFNDGETPMDLQFF